MTADDWTILAERIILVGACVLLVLISTGTFN